MDDRSVLTVTELNRTIRSLLENRFPFVSVAGEISNLHKPASGHLYFTLKDAGAQIKAVLFKMQQRYLAAQPVDGARVVCRGRISVYEPRGEYQLIVDTVDIQGAGALNQAFETLKRRLAAEGLFDEHLKRPPPPFPDHITLITAPGGAAVHDFIRIATRRFPPIRIAVYPATMQGDQAAVTMIEAIQAINDHGGTDLMVLCRGGGSTEDLWAFNDERLARAIRASALPVVSAVGHAIDFTIADFAADLRAPTPSAAAELLVPDGAVLRSRIEIHRGRMQRALLRRLDRDQQRLLSARQRLAIMPRPVERLMFHLDQLTGRLQSSLAARLATCRQRVDGAALALAGCNPRHRLDLSGQRLEQLRKRLALAIRGRLATYDKRFGRAVGVLHAIGPLATLARGYAIVRTTAPKRRIITEAARIAPNTEVEVILHRGRLTCRVTESVEEESSGERDGQSRAASTF